MAKLFDALRLVWGATDMRGADLSGLGDLSDFVKTVEGVNLDGADLRGTSFAGVDGVESASFVGAKMDDVDSGAASASGGAPDVQDESSATGLVHVPDAPAELEPIVLDAEPEHDWVSPDIIDVDVEEVVRPDDPAAEMDAADDVDVDEAVMPDDPAVEMAAAVAMDQADIGDNLGPDLTALAVVDAIRSAILGTVQDAQAGLRSYVRPRGF